MNKLQSFKKIEDYYLNHKNDTLLNLFNKANIEHISRFKQFSYEFHDLLIDFSKTHINSELLSLLIDLAHESNLITQINAMFDGEKLNNSENRAVLHTLLRANLKSFIDDIDDNNSSIDNMSNDININNEIGIKSTNSNAHDHSTITQNIHFMLNKMRIFSDSVNNQINGYKGYSNLPITDIVNIGIGGSHLGVNFLSQALKPYKQSDNINLHFISSVDAYALNDLLNKLNPAATLFIIVSKTFTTAETLFNAKIIKSWFIKHIDLYNQNNNVYKNDTDNHNKHAISLHFIAVTSNIAAAINFGIDVNNIFAFWDFIGGRYSVYSTVGLALAIYIGFNNFIKILQGANDLDEHFHNTHDLSKNIPVVMALINIWYINFCNFNSCLITPYSNRLEKLPQYLQQLEMESNGKSVNKNGDRISYHTSPIIWGDNGLNSQHAFYQLLHQGSSIIPMDIIAITHDELSDQISNDIVMANALAQSEALMYGMNYNEAYSKLTNSGIDDMYAKELAKHQIFDGNRPSTTILLKQLSPYNLGALLALYEHKVFTQGIIWQINSFDQMGVALGKELANNIMQNFNSSNANDKNNITNHDDSTKNLIAHYLLKDDQER